MPVLDITPEVKKRVREFCDAYHLWLTWNGFRLVAVKTGCEFGKVKNRPWWM